MGKSKMKKGYRKGQRQYRDKKEATTVRGKPQTVVPVRISQIRRDTSETHIVIKLNIDGKGKNTIKTGIPFLDHMLNLFSRHGFFDLDIKAEGDLDVDIHHTNEDIALTLGQTFAEGLGNKKGIRRFGFYYVPMEDALVRVSLDISNRPSLFIEGFPRKPKSYKQYGYADCEHFLKSFSQAAGLNLHVAVLSGRDRHHVIEAIFKALARSLDSATRIDKRNLSIPSTKGIL